jgi:molecular chaperone GrpE
MNGRRDIEAVLDQFRGWLEDARAQAESQHDNEPTASAATRPPHDFGLIDLVEEFTALRHELKLQTKSGRGLIDQTEGTVAALRQAIDQFSSVEPKEGQAAWSAAKGLAEALADLDEALMRGQREVDRARRLIADESIQNLEASITELFRKQSWICRRMFRPFYKDVIASLNHEKESREEVFEGFLEGYRLIHKRLRRALASEQVEHIPCEGKPVDPELMTVIELVDEPHDQPGTVANELRRGYTWKGRVIRFAEVQAVRGRESLIGDLDGDATLSVETVGKEFETETAEELQTADDSRSGPV